MVMTKLFVVAGAPLQLKSGDVLLPPQPVKAAAAGRVPPLVNAELVTTSGVTAPVPGARSVTVGVADGTGVAVGVVPVTDVALLLQADAISSVVAVMIDNQERVIPTSGSSRAGSAFEPLVRVASSCYAERALARKKRQKGRR
jgi:hypothetical protein